MKKILILGSSGSGKTYLGTILSKRLHIKQYDLDDIHYKKKFEVVRTKKEKRRIMDKLTKKKSWIITGVRYSWMTAAIKRADNIIILNRHPILESYRVTKRWIKRKLGPNPPREKLKALYDLITWNYQAFHTKKGEHVIRHDKIIKNYTRKSIQINSSKEQKKFLSKLRKE